jgi:hypothetical protein
MAATVVTRDPVFGWLAYGGALAVTNDTLSVLPHDGLRQRFDAIVGDAKDPALNIQRLKIELDRDGFAAGQAITLDKSLERISFTVENRTSDRHTSGLWLSFPAGTDYTLTQNGKLFPLRPTGDWDYPLRGDLEMDANPTILQLTKTQPRKN